MKRLEGCTARGRKKTLQALAVLVGGGFLSFQAFAAYDAITTPYPWLRMPLAVGAAVAVVASLVAWSSIGEAKSKAAWLKEGVRHRDSTSISDREADGMVELLELDQMLRGRNPGHRPSSSTGESL